MNTPAKMNFGVMSVRLSAHASQARCKQATIALDTDLAGKPPAFNPAEPLPEDMRKSVRCSTPWPPAPELSGLLRRKIATR